MSVEYFFFFALKWLKREVEHSPSSVGEITNASSYPARGIDRPPFSTREQLTSFDKT
jgi:hypothetical protein